MGTTKIIIALVLVSMGQLYGKMEQISNEGQDSEFMQNFDSFERENQWDYSVDTVKLSYAECDYGILNANRTIVISIDRRLGVVHSVAEAIAFLKSAKDNSSFIALIPTIDRVQMDATFCAQPQAEKDRALLAAVQAELPN